MPLDSIEKIFSGASWWECEIWDMFGVGRPLWVVISLIYRVKDVVRVTIVLSPSSNVEHMSEKPPKRRLSRKKRASKSTYSLVHRLDQYIIVVDPNEMYGFRRSFMKQILWYAWINFNFMISIFWLSNTPLQPEQDKLSYGLHQITFFFIFNFVNSVPCKNGELLE